MKKIIPMLTLALLLCSCGTKQNESAPEPADQTVISTDTSAAEISRPEETGDTTGTETASAENTETVPEGTDAAPADSQTDAAGQTAAPPIRTEAQIIATDSPQTNAPSPAQTDAPAVTGPAIGLLETVRAKPGQKDVPVSISIQENPGYMVCSVKLDYDAALSPKMTGEQYMNVFDQGDATKEAIGTCAANPDKHLIAFTCMGQKDITANGVLFTVYFDIPADAAPGTVYPIKAQMNGFVNAAREELDIQAVGGSIVIE